MCDSTLAVTAGGARDPVRLQVTPTNVQYTVTPTRVPSLKVTYTLVNVPRVYVRLQLLKRLLGN